MKKVFKHVIILPQFSLQLNDVMLAKILYNKQSTRSEAIFHIVQ